MYAPPPADSPVGFVRYGARDIGAFVAGAPRGRIGAEALRVLADLAARFGDGTLRATPWRALVLPGISLRDAAALADAAGRLGLIVDAADPRRALPGFPFEKAPRPGAATPETAER